MARNVLEEIKWREEQHYRATEPDCCTFCTHFFRKWDESILQMGLMEMCKHLEVEVSPFGICDKFERIQRDHKDV